jgi:hypothetical protein
MAADDDLRNLLREDSSDMNMTPFQIALLMAQPTRVCQM